jgi:hypothetical protein
MPQLSLDKGGAVRGGLRRMQATSDEAAQAMAHCQDSLDDHRDRTDYRTCRRGGYPLGSGGIEAANTCIDAYDMEIVDYH